MADYRVDVDVNVNAKELDNLKNTLKGINSKKINIGIDTGAALKKVNELESRIKRLGNVKLNVGGVAGNIQSEISNATKLLNNKSTVGKMSVGVDTSAAEREIAGLDAVIDRTGISVEQLKETLGTFNFGNNAINAITNNLEKTEAKIIDVKAQFKNDDAFVINVKGFDEFNREIRTAITLKKEFDKEGNFNGWSNPNITHTVQLYKESGKAVKQAASDAKQAASEIRQANAAINASTDSVSKVSGLEAKLSAVKEQSKEAVSSINALKEAQRELNSAAAAYKNDASAENRLKLVSAEKAYSQALRESTAQVNANVNADKMRTQEINKMNFELEKQKALLGSQSWLKQNSKAMEIYGDQIANINAQISKCNDPKVLANLQKQLQVVHLTAAATGQTGLTFGDKLKMQFSRLGAYFGASGVIMTSIQAGRAMVENVKDVDTQLTELYRVTDLSATQYSALYDTLTVSAQKYGVALTDLISATADWSRAGFDANTSAGLAEVTSVYQHISDLDYDEAAQNLLTAYKGFESELKEAFNGDAVSAVSYVSDILNELDNNYAVTAAGVGEAMKRSASAMSVAGNTIQETAGMITGISEVTQDPEKAGNALKVVSMRLRGMKGELEELGEETDESVENLSKMQGQILNLTHGRVNIFKDNGDFKSTYEILQGIAEVWDDITDTDRAELLETVAGKHRANDVAAIFQNWKHVEDATESATNATGSAMKEQEKYADSIQGRLNSLQAMWQQFSNTFMSSDLVKGAITALTGVLDVIEKIIDTIGGVGTAGIIGSFVLGFKHRNSTSVKSLLSQLSDLGSMLFDSFKSVSFKGLGGGVKGAKGLFGDLKASAESAKEAISNTFNSMNSWGKFKTVAAGIGIIGTAISIGLELWDSYVQKIEKTRQEAIDASSTFNDSFGSFEQAYIKYADKTVLTSDEESELTSAIDGTISALGNKSSALKDAAGASSEYVQNLDKIAEAELKQQQSLASKGKSSALERLNSNIVGGDNPGDIPWLDEIMKFMQFGAIGQFAAILGIGWKKNNADVRLPGKNTKEYAAIKDLVESDDFQNVVDNGGIFQSYLGKSYLRYDNVSSLGGLLGKKTDLESLDSSMKTFERYQSIVNRLEKTARDTGDDSYLSSDTYKDAASAIESISSNINDLTSNIYAGQKASYQLANGIPKTTEKFYEMQDAILSASSSTVEGRIKIAELMSEEYKNVFDLSSAKSQIEQFKSITKGIDSIGEDKEKTFETLIDLKTMVNNGECSVGDYTKALNNANNAINEIEKIDSSTANALRIKLDIEVDENGNIVDEVKQVRDKFVNALTDNKIDADVAAKFADSLNKQEIEAAVELIASGEIDMSDINTDNLDDKLRKKIEDYSKYLKAMKFDINIDTETEGFEKLNAALTESKTATGLTAESIGKLKDRYENLAGYNVAKLFEETANGIRLNTTEQQKLERAYSQSKLKEANENLSIAKSRYDELDKAIKNCTDASQMANYITEQNNIQEHINDLAQEAAMYEGLASKYKAWQDAESAGSDRDMYENVLGGFKEVEDELSRGWLDDASKAFLDMFSSSQLKSIDDYTNRFETLNDTIQGTTYSVKDFFTQNEDGESTNDGIYNFLDAVSQIDSSLVQRDENGNIISFDFGVNGEKAIADAMGISEELVQIILRASEDAGFTINMDGAYTSLADLQNRAQEANDTLVNLKANNKDFLSEFNQSDISFNFSERTLEGVGNQLDKAKTLLNSDQFKIDGKFNIDADGAKEALTIAQTLQAQWDQLNKPAYMTVDTSQVDKVIQEPIQKMQEFDNLSTQKHQMVLAGVDTSAVDKQMDDLVDYLYNLDPKIKTQLGIDQSSKEELKNDLENDEVSIPAELNIQAQMDSKLGVLVDQALHDAGLIDDEEYEKRLKVYINADIDSEDAEQEVEESNDEIANALGVSQDLIDKLNSELESSGVKDVLDSAQKGLEEWGKSVGETVSDWGDSISQGASDAWDAISNSPFGKMVGQIGGAISKNVEKVSGPAQELGNTLKGHADDIGNAISEKWSGFVDGVNDKVEVVKTKASDLWKSAKDGLSDLGDSIGEFFSDKWNDFTEGVKPITNALSILGEAFDKAQEIAGKFAGDKLSEAASGLSDFFKPLTDFFGNIKSFVESGDIFTDFGDWASGLLDNIGDGVSDFISGVNDFFKDPGGNISKAVSDFGQSIIDSIRSSLPRGINDIIDSADLFFDNNPGIIENTIGAFFNGMKDSIDNAVDGFIDSAKSKIDEIRSGLPDWLNNAFDFAGSFALDPFGTISGVIEEPLNNLEEKIKSAIEDASGKIKDSIPQPIKDCINAFKEAWSILSDDNAVQNAIDSIGDIDAQSVVDKINRAFDAVGNGIGVAIDTCKETVKSKIDDFRSGLPDWLNGLIDGFGEFTSSPVDFLSGLVENIETSIDKVFDDIKNKIDEKIEEIRSGLPDWLNGLIDGIGGIFNNGDSAENNYTPKNKWSDSDKIKSSMSDSFAKAGVTDEQEIDTYVKFFVNTDDVDSYQPEQKDAIVMFLKDVDDIDSYTPAQKQAIVDFIKNAKDVDSYTPEQKKAIVNYAVNGGEVDQYSPDDRAAIVNFLTNSADPDSYTPEQKQAIAKFLKDSGEVDGYQPGQKEAIARFLKDSSDPDSYQPPEKNGTAKYTADGSAVSSWTPPTLSGVVKYTAQLVGGAIDAISGLMGFGGVDGTAHVNGTALANGTTGKAFSQGDWGTKKDGVALGGELGTELLVRDGRWYTIGEDSAEFFGYKKGDIIFNADQTREIFEKGKITHGNGRGKALAEGTAFSRGSGGLGRSNKGSSVSSSSSSYSSSSSSDSSSDSSASEEAEKFEETLDLIEIMINRIERAISRLDKTASSTYKKWSKRNTALNSQINETRNEIDLQQRAYDRYMQQANSVGLSEDYASKVRNGTIDIETITDEDLNDKIKDYQTWFEKALDCKDAIDELRESESKLYEQRFNNVSTKYEGYLGVIEHEKDMLDEFISQSETAGYITSTKYYDALSSNAKKTMEQLKKQRDEMTSELNNAVNSGTIDKYSESWYSMVSAIDDVTKSIEEQNTALLEYKKNLRELDWQVFDLIQDKISKVADESQFLIDLMDNKKLYEDNGQLTDEGMATMGQYGVKYNTYMNQADRYAKKIKELQADLAKDPYNQDITNQLQEYIEAQQEAILNAEDMKNSIKDMVSEGIDKELDALQKLIDKYNDSLDSAKDLYEYQKDIAEKTKNIAELEKQLSSYQGDTSEETKAKIQQIKVDLEDAKSDLQETEYDRYIQDQQKILDDLSTEYETILNQRLDDIDALMSDMIAEINNNASTIGTTITEQADKVGYTLSQSMQTIWLSGNGNISSVITKYGDNFTGALTTTNTALNNISTNVANMITQLNKLAGTKIKAAGASSAATEKPAAKPSTPAKQPQQQQPQQKQITVGGQINAGGATIYATSYGGGGGSQYFGSDPIYTVLSENNGFILTRWHGLSSGYTGWFKKSDVSAYKTGTKNIRNNEVAWTQEDGSEMIMRPSDGAILTPLAKNDSVLNASASKNIWDMANSPSDFIKNNLDLEKIDAGANVGNQTTYTQTIENVVFDFKNVKNYDEILRAMQNDRNFERLISAMTIDRLAGKSSLAKGKSIR